MRGEQMIVKQQKWKWESCLYSQGQMDLISRHSENDSWKIEAFKSSTKKISHQDFPCPFSKHSVNHKKVWFSFMDCSESEEYPEIVQQLQEYTAIFKESEYPYNFYYPLIVSIKTPKDITSLGQYNEFAWKLLQYIHDNDCEAWPQDVPKEPEEHLWSFAFSGIQLFVNVSTPAHKNRNSRNFGPCLTLVINPRMNFDYVAGDTPQGDEIRKNVRERIKNYDTVPICNHLGTYGVESNLEWKQYAIGDGIDDQAFSKCPIHIT